MHLRLTFCSANNEETQAFAREYHTSHNPEDKDVGFLHEATQAEADESDEDEAPVKMSTREREEHIRALIEVSLPCAGTYRFLMPPAEHKGW